ncbi:MAG TPA: isochorismatase family protein [Candidatus Norongarragalinales archaeon]|nr:isochorismatase family protein [Candidatus Norongarragalinales archaeon]
MLIFFDSDTQNDFILAAGKMSVHGAENIRKNLQSLTAFGRKRRLKIISSVDRHFGTAKYRGMEMTELEVWGGPFPMHCMDGTPGQKKIKETASRRPCVIENRPYSAAALKKACKSSEIIIEKQKFSPFSNPNLPRILRMLKVKKAVLYGVTTDYSMRSAALEMRRLGIDVYLVTDASRSYNVKPNDGEISVRQMHAAGVHMVSTEKVLRELPLA